MTDRPLPSPELLRKLLDYNPDTGILLWRERPASMFKSLNAAKGWNARFAGKEAFIFTNKDGYRIGGIHKRLFNAHRVIWAMQMGEWPKDEVDHINRKPSDNRWENLRAASRAQNTQNKTSHKNSSSKFLGVSWHPGKKKWCAEIVSHGTRTYLGSFTSEVEAAAAYDRAARERHGKFANANFAQDP
jgi:hypothetical protein